MKKFVFFLLPLFLLIGISTRSFKYYVKSTYPIGEVLVKDGQFFYCLIDSVPDRSLVIKKVYMQSQLGMFHTYSQVEKTLENLSNKYPERCNLLTVGNSYEGRNIYCLRFKPKKPAPAFLIIGCHHAREWMSVEIPLEFAKFLAENLGGSPKVEKYLEDFDIWIIPMLNPDGHEYTLKENRMWRKNRTPFKSIIGVDLNRNYGYHWNGMGSSGDPNSEIYQGPKPFSESETSVIKGIADSVPLIGCITYHTFGELILYPWGYSTSTPTFKDNLEEIAVGMARLSGPPNDGDYADRPYANEFDYVPMQGANLYETAGECCDYLFATHGTIAFTIEMGSTKQGFDPPDSEISPTLQQVMPFNFYFLDEVPKKFGVVYGKVTDGLGNPSKAKIRIVGADENITVHPETGRFYVVLPRGRHFINIDGKQTKLEVKGGYQYYPITVENRSTFTFKGELKDPFGETITGTTTLYTSNGLFIDKKNGQSFTFKVKAGKYLIKLTSGDFAPIQQTVIISANLELDYLFERN